MSLEEFRIKVNGYRRAAGLLQKTLAARLGLHPNVLSNKLNGTGDAILTGKEIRQLVKILAEEEAITEQAQALELLALAGIASGGFSPDEWQKPPLNKLNAAPVKPNAPPGARPDTVGPPRRTNLPAPLTGLIGREQAVRQVGELLAEPGVRLLTLTGPGGTGKTRLALQVAAEALPVFPDGVFFVPLAPIRQPALVGPAIATVLGLKESQEGRPQVELQRWLAARTLLLVLDNFEHLLPAAVEVAGLLEAAPGLKVVVTSREILRIYGEYQFGVAPLELPNTEERLDSATLAGYPAIRLFIERARAALPGFKLTAANAALVYKICRRLDGLPLAIELAAARIQSVPVETMLERLKGGRGRFRLLSGGPRNQPERQQTLRNTIEWSYDLLDEVGQQLFNRLGIFVAGWSVEAAAQVGGPAGCDPAEMLERLEQLLAKSLLVRDSPPDGLEAEAENARYYMLDTLREYALEQLERRGETGVIRRRMAGYYLDLAEMAAQALAGLRSMRNWLARLDRERDNLREVLRRSLEADDPESEPELETGLRMAAALWRFWLARGYLSEGRQFLAEALGRTAGEAETGLARPRAEALYGAGVLAFYQGDYIHAAACYRESLALFDCLGDRLGRANVLSGQAQLARTAGDYTHSRQLYEQALTIFQEVGEPPAIFQTAGSLGIALWQEGRYEQARDLMAGILKQLRGLSGAAMEKTYGIGAMLLGLGWAYLSLGQTEQAGPYFEEAAGLLRSINRRYYAQALLGSAYVATRFGETGRGRTLFLEGLAIHSNEELHDRWGLAWFLEGLAGLEIKEGRHAQAARLYGAAEATLAALNIPAFAFLKDEREVALPELRRRLDPASLQLAWEQGRSLDLPDLLQSLERPG